MRLFNVLYTIHCIALAMLISAAIFGLISFLAYVFAEDVDFPDSLVTVELTVIFIGIIAIMVLSA